MRHARIGRVQLYPDMLGAAMLGYVLGAGQTWHLYVRIVTVAAAILPMMWGKAIRSLPD
ncbi:hypothetical protein SEA_SCHMIDT_76 [Gordonia phage Schmidt]|uniref:Uncharacterized protein n=1 Tax=Gordonia phage Schmidt TaxID=2301697 RepID=A0A385E2U8_9CAUD|nr:hypothetical protein KDJ59_gp76 [Gordonia phage Schmidt]AXQ65195.1 hypothetical protein SEA_SCHMIDT_76 [Gordonia phage Schmidt]